MLILADFWYQMTVASISEGASRVGDNGWDPSMSQRGIFSNYIGGIRHLCFSEDDDCVGYYLSWQILKDRKVSGGIFNRINFKKRVWIIWAEYTKVKSGAICQSTMKVSQIRRRWKESIQKMRTITRQVACPHGCSWSMIWVIKPIVTRASQNVMSYGRSMKRILGRNRNFCCKVHKKYCIMGKRNGDENKNLRWNTYGAF